MPFDAGETAHAQVHAAIAELPGTQLHPATWRGEDTPTQVTTTVSLVGSGYELDIIDQESACSIVVNVLVHVTVETSDGYLLLEEQVTWGQRGLTQPSTPAGEIELGARLSAATDGSAWLGFPVAQMWPDVAQADDDDAELVIDLVHRAGELRGLLYYSRRELIDDTTVIHRETPLLEWGPA